MCAENKLVSMRGWVIRFFRGFASSVGDGKFVRFILMGFLLQVTGIGIFAVLYLVTFEWLSYKWVFFLAYGINFVLAFGSYRRFVFRSERSVIKTFFSYLLSTQFTLWISFLILILAVEIMQFHPLAAQIGTTIVLAPIMFLVSRFFVFR